MKYYIEVGSINKAKNDIDEICQREGFVNLTKINFGSNGIGRFLTKLVSTIGILFYLRKNDILLLQYPVKKFYKTMCRFARWKGAKVVTIIHDLGAFRRKKLTPEQENKRLALTDFLIVHNRTMHDYLREHGYKGGIHNLDIFDYLSDETPGTYDTPHTPWKILYAGNLGHWRNEFLYKLNSCTNSWEFDLYGKGFEPEKNSCNRLHYHGFTPSDKFIREAKGDFGLVWDGDSLDECTGAWGEYLRINNPHKTSFYIRAGIPVIVWSKAAMTPFVKNNKIGIAVDSIKDIDKELAKISPEEYQEIRKSVAKVRERLSNGYYFKEGFKSAMQYLGNNTDI